MFQSAPTRCPRGLQFSKNAHALPMFPAPLTLIIKVFWNFAACLLSFAARYLEGSNEVSGGPGCLPWTTTIETHGEGDPWLLESSISLRRWLSGLLACGWRANIVSRNAAKWHVGQDQNVPQQMDRFWRANSVAGWTAKHCYWRFGCKNGSTSGTHWFLTSIDFIPMLYPCVDVQFTKVHLLDKFNVNVLSIQTKMLGKLPERLPSAS